MKYKKWTNKEGKRFSIKDMSDEYIKNCAYMIIRSINPVATDEKQEFFGGAWTQKHGKKYLKAFYKELESRRKEQINIYRRNLGIF